MEQGTPAWHRLRKNKVTASNAYKLLTKGKAAALDVEPVPDNEYMKRGRELEPEAIEIYERIYELKVRRVGFITNDNYPDAGYSPDGIAGSKLLEVKCFNATKHRKIFIDSVPPEVMAQCQFGMMIANKKKCDLVLYNPDLDPIEAFRIINLTRDEAIINNIKEKLKGD